LRTYRDRSKQMKQHLITPDQPSHRSTRILQGSIKHDGAFSGPPDVSVGGGVLNWL
jgi:hypothetical protein